MKKMNKRLISLVLAVIMIAGVMAVGFSAFAADECDHAYVYTDNGNGTHTGKCSKCNDEITEKHDLTYKNNDDGTHTETCVVCGYSKKVDHTYNKGLCDCGDYYSCDLSGHVVDTSKGIYADEICHYYVCSRCNYKVYYDGGANGEGLPTFSAITVSTSGSVTPEEAAHSGRGVITDAPEKDEQCPVCKSKHIHSYVKKENVAAKCENFPFDIYRCTECRDEVYVKTGSELGHYWPVMLDENENPVRVDENGNLVSDGTTGAGLVADDRYVTVEWGENHESCKITLTCQRPDCDYGQNGAPKTLTYTVYTKENVVGKITKSTYTAKPCQASTITYTAEFKLPDVPKDMGGEFLYVRTESEVVTIPATAKHVPGDAIASESKAPTCTEAGYTVSMCKVCGDKLTAEEVPALGHNYTTKVMKEATCTSEGLQVKECANCGKTEKEIIEAKGHSLADSAIISEPTCTEEGCKSGKCTVCGYEGKVQVPALGHDFETVTGGNGKAYKRCKKCGLVENSCLHNQSCDLNFDYVCDTCGTDLKKLDNYASTYFIHYLTGKPVYIFKLILNYIFTLGGKIK